MKVTGLPTIDHAPQIVAEWLNELQDELGWADRHRAYMLLRATLHAIRDFLSVDEAADLAAQLPVLVRGIYYEGWVPSRTPVYPRSRQDFVARITGAFSTDPLRHPERAIEAVFHLLQRRLSAGELAQVAWSMRKPLREMWM